MEVSKTQVSRWSFTLWNYDRNYDYLNHLKRHEFKVKRCVFSHEVDEETGIAHIHGYLELWRTMRLSHMRKILPRAHWKPAKKSSLVNYRGCVKGEKSTYLVIVSSLQDEYL